MKKLLCLLIIFALIIVPFEARCECYNGIAEKEGRIIVNGVCGNELAGKRATLVVLGKDKTITDLESEYNTVSDDVTSLESVVYFDETTVDADGNFTFRFVMPSDSLSGDYICFSKVGDKEFSGSIRMVLTDSKIAAIKEINKALSANLEVLTEAIKNNRFVLSLFLGYEEKEDEYNIVSAQNDFFEIMKSWGKYSEDREEINNSILKFNENIKKTIDLLKIKSFDNIDDLKEYIENNSEYLGLDISLITPEISDDIYNTILNPEKIPSVNYLNNLIKDKALIILYKNSVTWGDVKRIIEGNSDFFDVDLTLKDVDYAKIYHTLYNEIDKLSSNKEIKTRFNELVKTCKKESKPSSSGGGGGGGGGGIISTPKTPVVAKDTVPENTLTKQNVFKDIKDDFWAFKDIMSLYNKNIIKGKSNDMFAPEEYITRAEFSALVVRAFDLRGRGDFKGFSDVSEKDWFYDTVKIASENEIVRGIDENSFLPTQNISRQDIAVICHRLLNNIKEDTELSFSDREEISDYAKDAVKCMVALGIIKGTPNNEFCPTQPATRAETAKILSMMLEEK